MKSTSKRTIIKSTVTALLLSVSMLSSAAVITQIDQAYNSFQSNVVTGNAQLGVDAATNTAITSGVELPGFAFGTYNVDATATSITMSLLADPLNLGIAIYNEFTFDRYFFEFDQLLSSASINVNSNPNFAATVELVEAGSVFSFDGGFLPSLPTEITMANGGILITIGSGTDLFAVGQGGELTVDFTAVPVPPVVLLVLSGVAAIMWRRTKNS